MSKTLCAGLLPGVGVRAVTLLQGGGSLGRLLGEQTPALGLMGWEDGGVQAEGREGLGWWGDPSI